MTFLGKKGHIGRMMGAIFIGVYGIHTMCLMHFLAFRWGVVVESLRSLNFADSMYLNRTRKQVNQVLKIYSWILKWHTSTQSIFIFYLCRTISGLAEEYLSFRFCWSLFWPFLDFIDSGNGHSGISWALSRITSDQLSPFGDQNTGVMGRQSCGLITGRTRPQHLSSWPFLAEFLAASDGYRSTWSLTFCCSWPWGWVGTCRSWWKSSRIRMLVWIRSGRNMKNCEKCQEKLIPPSGSSYHWHIWTTSFYFPTFFLLDSWRFGLSTSCCLVQKLEKFYWPTTSPQWQHTRFSDNGIFIIWSNIFMITAILLNNDFIALTE